jgi:large subunit ribosomal protein L10
MSAGAFFVSGGGVPRAEKEEKVREIAERLKSAAAAVITDYRGLSTKDAAELRSSLEEVDTRFSVVKNTLTRLAVKEAGLDRLIDFVDGPTAIAFILGDPVAGAKRLVEAARRLPVIDVRGGFAEGRVLTADQVRELAALQSRDVMLARIAGLAKSQVARTAFALQALQVRFLRLMEALKDKTAEMPEAPDQEGRPAETETEPSAPEAEPAAPTPETPEETEPTEGGA